MVGAPGPERVTVQVPDEPAVTLPSHVSDERSALATREMEVVWLDEPSVALTLAVPAAVTRPAVAVNVALVVFAGMVTEAGTVRVALFEDSVTTLLFVGSGYESVTVHEVVALLARLFERHCSDDRVNGAWRLTVAVCDAPLRVAVTIAVALLVMVPARAEN